MSSKDGRRSQIRFQVPEYSYMKQKYVHVIKLFVDDGIMGHPKLVKAAVDHFYRVLWIFPGLWINQSSTM